MNDQLRHFAAQLARIEEKLDQVIEGRAEKVNKNVQIYTTSCNSELLTALRRLYGPSAFMASTVIDDSGDDPALRSALMAVVNLSSRRPAITLGRLLARMPGVQAIGDHRGAMLFRLL